MKRRRPIRPVRESRSAFAVFRFRPEVIVGLGGWRTIIGRIILIVGLIKGSRRQ